jgi:hypothetical protein
MSDVTGERTRSAVANQMCGGRDRYAGMGVGAGDDGKGETGASSDHRPAQSWLRGSSASPGTRGASRCGCEGRPAHRPTPAPAAQRLRATRRSLPGRFHPQLLDQNRRGIGKSQSTWTTSKMEMPRLPTASPEEAAVPERPTRCSLPMFETNKLSPIENQCMLRPARK